MHTRTGRVEAVRFTVVTMEVASIPVRITIIVSLRRHDELDLGRFGGKVEKRLRCARGFRNPGFIK